VVLQDDGSLTLNLSGYGTDAEGDALTATVVGQPSHGTLTGVEYGHATLT
jgi:hypothetical protein